MTILMDGHEVSQLVLNASDGTSITKVLTEFGTIPTPTNSITITENGEVDVLNFAKALVNVAGSGGGETVEGTYYCGNWNTQSYVPFGETWEDYIAFWEYLGEVPEETQKKVIKGIAIHTINLAGLSSEFNLFCSLTYPESTSGAYGYSQMFIGTHTSQNDSKFSLKTLYSLPDGYDSVNPNIRYKVIKL